MILTRTDRYASKNNSFSQLAGGLSSLSCGHLHGLPERLCNAESGFPPSKGSKGEERAGSGGAFRDLAFKGVLHSIPYS